MLFLPRKKSAMPSESVRFVFSRDWLRSALLTSDGVCVSAVSVSASAVFFCLRLRKPNMMVYGVKNNCSILSSLDWIVVIKNMYRVLSAKITINLE